MKSKPPDAQVHELGTPAMQLELVDAPAGMALRGHGHEEPHLCVVTSGSFAERDVGGRYRDVDAGTARFSPAGDVHELVMSAAGMSCVLVLLRPLLAAGAPTPAHRAFQRTERLASLGGRLESAARAHESPIMLELMVLELLAASSCSTGSARGCEPHWLVRIREALLDRPQSPPSTAELAAEAGLHPVYVARAFRRWFGCSLSTYAQLVRLDHARRLLLDTALPLSHVACAAGYADQSHLTRALRHRVGLAPGQLRRLQVSRVQDMLPRQAHR